MDENTLKSPQESIRDLLGRFSAGELGSGCPELVALAKNLPQPKSVFGKEGRGMSLGF
jgi:hypothetical protein